MPYSGRTRRRYPALTGWILYLLAYSGPLTVYALSYRIRWKDRTRQHYESVRGAVHSLVKLGLIEALKRGEPCKLTSEGSFRMLCNTKAMSELCSISKNCPELKGSLYNQLVDEYGEEMALLTLRGFAEFCQRNGRIEGDDEVLISYLKGESRLRTLVPLFQELGLREIGPP